MSFENAELEAKHQTYKGRVVVRGDIVKDDSGSYAVFTEQGSSASQMTAAKIMDIISRLPGFDGQAADAVSAETQVKMKDAHKLLKIPKSECPDIWIRLPRHKWPKSWSSMEDPGRSSWTKSVWSSSGRTIVGKAIWEKSYWNMAGRKFQIGNVSLYIVKKDVFLSVHVDDIKLAGKETKILIRCGTYSTKKSIWENQHLSWIMKTWAALNDNAK